MFLCLGGMLFAFSGIILQSNIKGIEVLAVSLNKILFCALVQMK